MSADFGTVGERIRAVRGTYRNQAQFASLTGVFKGSIFSYENNHRLPGSAFLTRCVDDLGISANWILTGKGSMFTSDEIFSTDEQIEPASLIEVMDGLTNVVKASVGERHPEYVSKLAQALALLERAYSGSEASL